MSQMGKSLETDSRCLVTRDWGGGCGVTAHGYHVSFEGDRMFPKEPVAMATQLCEGTKTTVCFREVNCLVCEMYLSSPL